MFLAGRQVQGGLAGCVFLSVSQIFLVFVLILLVANQPAACRQLWVRCPHTDHHSSSQQKLVAVTSFQRCVCGNRTTSN